MNEIAITGIGVISSLGVGREPFWANCRQATTGIKKITSFDTSTLRSDIAGCVEDFDPGQFMPPSMYRRMSRISRMAVASSLEALRDSGLNLDNIDREKIAIIMGTAYGSSACVEDFFVSLLKDGPRGAQPFYFPETVPNAPAGHISMVLQITGPNCTFCQNEISAESAILYARHHLLQNHVDVALVGGADELSARQYACYDALGVLASIKVKRDEPIRPKPGDGLILGEGAGVLVLERLDSAVKRGAEIYGILKSGVITGGIASNGNYEVTGEQMARSISRALNDAGITIEELDQYNVSANFSGVLDCMEYNQLQNIFKGSLSNLVVTPLKYLMGDFGGAGVIRAAATLLSLHYQLPLPTVRVEALKCAPPSELDWDVKPNINIQTAIMTTSAIGGASACLIFRNHQ